MEGSERRGRSSRRKLGEDRRESKKRRVGVVEGNYEKMEKRVRGGVGGGEDYKLLRRLL